MRIFLCAMFLILNFPAKAATYLVDLNSIGSADMLVGPCYCGSGPLFPFLQFQPGDVVDFGKVQIFSFYDAHDAGRSDPDGLLPPETFNFQGAVSVVYDPSSYPWPEGAFGASLGSSAIFDLQFTIPVDGTGIQIGWDGDGVYTPPTMTAVPEASTWAMLLVGFAAIGFTAYRRRIAAAAAISA